jgi:hypothetical protein
MSDLAQSFFSFSCQAGAFAGMPFRHFYGQITSINPTKKSRSQTGFFEF